jgi:hypothetical protein
MCLCVPKKIMRSQKKGPLSIKAIFDSILGQKWLLY